METRYCWNGTYPVTTQLRQLLTSACVHIDESVHITNHESLGIVSDVCGMELPVWLEYGHPAAGLEGKDMSVSNLGMMC